ncbi:MAG TPA: endonuclease/exonuclease/phosphatase family protein [Victivallales bacterium]|nr:endonuclease/exonuclease/phosphatase family protein [Victivallales bacterium]
MRLLVYNIAYGTGHSGLPSDHIRKAHRFLRTSSSVLDKIAEFISGEDPDIVGLIEVDIGSSRTRYVNQALEIASRLKHHHLSAVKYSRQHIASSIPIVRLQANAILSRDSIPSSNFHFMPCGIKRLVIEAEIGGTSFFLVHLSVRRNIRTKQIAHLAKIANQKRPLIIAGDFNTFSGVSEIEILKKTLHLYDANSDELPTFPSYRPRRQLDFVLCSHEVKKLNFKIPNVSFSDHLPIIFDFET